MMGCYFHLELKPVLGMTIESCIRDALRIAKQLNVYVEFQFNDHRVIVNPERTEEETLDRWVKKVGEGT